MADQPVDAPEIEMLKYLDFGTESDLVDSAVVLMQGLLPEWEPRQGNTEVVLMQAFALMLGPEIMAVQLLGGRMIEGLMGLYGVVRSAGTPARARVTFTVTDSNATQTIPKNTRLRLQTSATGETVDFLTDEALVIITSDTLSGDVWAVADIPGTLPNGAATGTLLAVVAPLPFVESARLAEPVAGGTDGESDGSFYARAASTLGRQVSTLVQAIQFEYAALTRPEVGRAKGFDLYDPARPAVSATGHVTVAAADRSGEPLTAEQMQEIENWLTSQALASLLVHVIAPTYTDVQLFLTVKAAVGYDESAVKLAVGTAMAAWISPETWMWESQISQNAIIARVGAIPGVREVQVAPATIPLPGKAPLPRLTFVNVTVN